MDLAETLDALHAVGWTVTTSRNKNGATVAQAKRYEGARIKDCYASCGGDTNLAVAGLVGNMKRDEKL